MRLFRHLTGRGQTAFASLHDLGLAACYCTRLLMLAEGRVVADGPLGVVLTAENVARAFGITAHMAQGPHGLLFLPLDLIGP